MIIAGGYYRGFETMVISLTKILIPERTTNPRWSYLGYLPEERQWQPALGLVAGKPTIATGIALNFLNRYFYKNFRFTNFQIVLQL